MRVNGFITSREIGDVSDCRSEILSAPMTLEGGLLHGPLLPAHGLELSHGLHLVLVGEAVAGPSG